jgi:ribosomal protein S18 acetylase RimI-like enzyme
MIEFRPMTDDDVPFLMRLYASTREEELSCVPWSNQQKDQFLQMQFRAQHICYQEKFPEARFNVILIDGKPAGRLYLHRALEEHRIIDIALLPQYRGRGIGKKLMQDILDQAAEAEKTVRIHVEQNNPAMRLYDRLGFDKVGDTGVYYLMEWIPPSMAATK